ncbi:hypothetical protein HG531_005164 [Fusarium graminearum]|nr:hypothetical protein HG531_005164 [Fusarium graminearum]
MRLLSQIHICEIIVRFKEVLDGIPDELGLLFKSAHPLRQNKKHAQLVSINVILKFAENMHDRLPHRLKVGFELRRDRRQYGF